MVNYVIYTDGSYKKNLKLGASAYVIFKDDVLVAQFSKVFDDPETLVAWNVGPEIKACQYALIRILTFENDFETEINIDIYHDYVGVADWATGKWKKTQHKFAKDYVNFIKDLSKNVHLNFHKVKGHSGNKYNDLVDSLCTKAYKEYNHERNN